MSFGSLLDKFAGLRAVVVGDLMLDEYIFGRATRISPEAPVMVIRQDRTAHVPGGAANVARNLAALGAETRVAGVVGCDDAGSRLAAVLTSGGVASLALVEDGNRSTTRKTRVLADSAHQVLRIDAEDDTPISGEVESRLIEGVSGLLTGADVVLLSDYMKGTLSGAVIREVVAHAGQLGIPVVANAKPRSFSQFSGCALVSLNRAEATAALDLPRPLEPSVAGAAAQELAARAAVGAVLITLGEAGMAVGSAEGAFMVPAAKVEVYDTAGAGDTVIATVALGLAAVGLEPEVFALAAQTSASVVRKVGVAIPSQEDLDALRS